MKLNEIYKLSEQLSDSLKSINEMIEEKEVAHSNIQHWSTHEDLFNNLGSAVNKLCKLDGEIALNEDKIILIINQLNNEIQ
jgi:hypothetical protein